MHQTRQRLINIYGLDEGTGVFVMPSGSDAEYIPLVIAKHLNGMDAKITNIVTCNEEVGSGTLDASGGLFFSPIEPIPGYTAHMQGGADMHDPLLELAENVKTVAIDARLPNGEVVDSNPKIKETLDAVSEQGGVPILHSVYGSKTGITQDLQVQYADQIKEMNGLYVVDACQGRFDDKMVYELLEQGVIVLITGSKFFRGPPFSGACIVPKSIMSKLLKIQSDQVYKKPVAAGLNTFMGKAEIPRELTSWRDCLEDNQNPGLALRWVAALAEIEKTLQIEEKVRKQATDHWRKQVIDEISKYPNLDYFSAAEDTPSIVSLRIIHPDSGKWMVKSELAKVFKALTLDMSQKFPENDTVTSRICFTGQPVLISKEEAVLRLALGSDSLREVIDNMDVGTNSAAETDFKILEKMSYLGGKFNEL